MALGPVMYAKWQGTDLETRVGLFEIWVWNRHLQSCFITNIFFLFFQQIFQERYCYSFPNSSISLRKSGFVTLPMNLFHYVLDTTGVLW